VGAKDKLRKTGDIALLLGGWVGEKKKGKYVTAAHKSGKEGVNDWVQKVTAQVGERAE